MTKPHKDEANSGGASSGGEPPKMGHPIILKFVHVHICCTRPAVASVGGGDKSRTAKRWPEEGRRQQHVGHLSVHLRGKPMLRLLYTWLPEWACRPDGQWTRNRFRACLVWAGQQIQIPLAGLCEFLSRSTPLSLVKLLYFQCQSIPPLSTATARTRAVLDCPATLVSRKQPPRTRLRDAYNWINRADAHTRTRTQIGALSPCGCRNGAQILCDLWILSIRWNGAPVAHSAVAGSALQLACSPRRAGKPLPCGGGPIAILRQLNVMR